MFGKTNQTNYILRVDTLTMTAATGINGSPRYIRDAIVMGNEDVLRSNCVFEVALLVGPTFLKCRNAMQFHTKSGAKKGTFVAEGGRLEGPANAQKKVSELFQNFIPLDLQSQSPRRRLL